MSNATTQGTTRVRLYVTDCSPRVLTTYRGLRKRGFARRDANLIIIGVVIATGDGIVDIKKASQP